MNGIFISLSTLIIFKISDQSSITKKLSLKKLKNRIELEKYLNGKKTINITYFFIKNSKVT